MTNMPIRILVLGGGFGGIRAALDLGKKFKNHSDVKVTLIDKNDYQTFTPALYEIASIYGVDHQHPFHTKLRGMISIPYGEIFHGRGVELVQAEVNHVDLGAKHVVTNNGTTIVFDYLVIALGSAVSTFGIPGVGEYAYKFKTIEDGLMLNDKVEQLYIEASESKRPLPITILIGGAGFNGVELAAELSNCAVHIAHRHDVKQLNCTAITLLEAGPVILPMVSDKERGLIEKRLKELGINIMLDSPIKEVGSDWVKLKDDRTLKGDLIIWSGGLKALDILKNADNLQLDERGRIFANDCLQVNNYSNVFAVGDNIAFIDPATQKPIPQMAFLAIEQGSLVAKNIIKIINGSRELKKYEPHYNVWIAPVGGKNAVAHLWGWNFSGFMGYLLREVVDLRYFLTVLPFFRALGLFFRQIGVFSKND